LIRLRLRAPAVLNVAALDRIVANLASDVFAVRAKATDELENRGRSVVAELKARIQKIDSLEAKRRLTALVERFESGPLFPEELRALRSLEFLERIATPSARTAIVELTNGEPAAELTVRARAAKARLDRRKS